MTDEQIDKVYGNYFRHEMPAELPPLVLSRVRGPRSESRSRYVLAASVAALLGLGLAVSSTMSSVKPTAKGSASKLLKDAQADGKGLLDQINQP